MEHKSVIAKKLSVPINETALTHLVIALSLISFAVIALDSEWSFLTWIGVAIFLLYFLFLKAYLPFFVDTRWSLKILQTILSVDKLNISIFIAVIAIGNELLREELILAAFIIYVLAYLSFFIVYPQVKRRRSKWKKKIQDYEKLDRLINEGYLIIGDKIDVSQPNLELALNAVSLFSHLDPRIFLDKANYDRTLILLRHPVDSARIEAILTSDSRTVELANHYRERALYEYQCKLGQLGEQNILE